MKALDITDWEDVEADLYEKMVAAILAGQLKECDGIHSVNQSVQYPYKHGEKEIDVLVTGEAPDGDTTGHTTLIECKNHRGDGYSANIEQDVIASTAFYLDNSKADAAVVVAREGFQTGAKNIARDRNDIRLFTIGEVTAEDHESIDTLKIDFTLSFSDYRHFTRVAPISGEDSQRLREVALGSSSDFDLLAPDGTPIGETLYERIESNARGKSGKITTEFDGERIEIDGKEYEVLEAVSKENPSGSLSSEQVIEDAGPFEVKMADPLALEDTDEEEPKPATFRTFKEMRRDLIQWSSENNAE